MRRVDSRSPGEDWIRQVLVVEDDAFVRGLVASLLEDAGFRVVTADSASAALAALDEVDPDAAVLDIELGSGPNGVDLAQVLIREFPHLALVFLTQVASPDLIGLKETVPARAAYLVKRELADPRALVDALESVLADQLPTDFMAGPDASGPLARLTAAQLDTLRLVAAGLSNEGIARETERSQRAVESMVSRIFAVLGLAGDGAVNARVIAARMYGDYAGAPPLHVQRGTA